MLYILTGPDDYSRTRSLDEIKKEMGDPAALTMSATTLDGKQVTADELRTTCQTLPFLDGKRLVIVEGLLERFEPRSQPRRPPRRTRQTNDQPPAQDKHKPFSAAVEKLPDSTILVLVEGGINAGNPLFKELSGRATVKAFPMLKEPQLREWAQRRVVAGGGSISPKAVTLLVRLVGSNLWIMASEIDKLLLFASSRRIEEEDVKTMVGYAQQTTVFVMVDAILESRAEAAGRALQQLLQSGAAPAYLLTMLARQIQMIVRARELKNQRKPNSEIQSRLGLTAEFIVRKTLEQASRFSLPRLREVYRNLLETDLSIKTGQYDAELALTILVAQLCQRDKPQATRAVK